MQHFLVDTGRKTFSLPPVSTGLLIILLDINLELLVTKKTNPAVSFNKHIVQIS